MDIPTYTIKTVLLTLIGSQDNMKGALLYSILVGKRTPSILYQAKRLKLENYFSVFEKLTREQFQLMLNECSNEDLIVHSEKDIYSVPQAIKNRSWYTTKDQLDEYMHGFFRYQKLLPVFWVRFQLFIQVVSEKRHGQISYRPITNELTHQKWIKKWILQSEKAFDTLAEVAAEEIFQLLYSLPTEKAEMITLLLTGHEKNGRTMNQIKERFEIKSNMTFLFILIQTQLLLVQTIQDDPEAYSHLNTLLTSVDKETFYGLNESTFISLALVKNQSIEQVAQTRNLKMGTIKEHILEIALTQNKFSLEPFISKETLVRVNQLNNEDLTVPYTVFRKKFEEIDFFDYRLIQIERMRKDEHE